MSLTVPAIRGRMGSIDFFLTKLRASNLTGMASAASEIPDWERQKMEERIQRELNRTRVESEIVPYLENSADRFFSAVLVLVRDPETFEFEALNSIGVPTAYKPAVDDMGALTIDGGKFVVLDGQHRYAALRSVIQAEEHQRPRGPYAGQVADDELAVLFVRLDLETTRRVFSKINKHAKTTSIADNIIINEDDGYAILTRRLLEPDAPLGVEDGEHELLVKWRSASNTLSRTERRFTTVSAVYETVKSILDTEKIRNFDEKHRVVRPSEQELQTAYDKVALWWSTFIAECETVAGFLEDPDRIVAARDVDPPSTDSIVSLLSRPATHIIIFMAVGRAKDRGADLTTCFQRIDGLDWSHANPMWRDLLVLPSGRISARRENYRRSADLLAYLLAPEFYQEESRKVLEASIAEFRGQVAAGDAIEDSDEEIYTLPLSPYEPSDQ